MFVSCRDRHEQLASGPDVNVDVMLPMTPIRDQGHTQLCWIYAMLATIETDCLAKGDSVSLSPAWLERKMLEEQAVETYLMGRKVTTRGTLMEAMRLFNKYGIVGWDAAPPTESSAVARKIEHTALAMSAQRKGIQALHDATTGILDDSLGPMPRFVFMLGMEYTPGEFARSCAMPDDWKAYSSFTHHAYGEAFPIEIKDNRQRLEVTNVPLDTLYNKVVESIRHRHPVAWEGTLSLRSKLKSDRVKELSWREYSEQRQKAFETFRLTDDHCMAIVGLGHAKDGTQVFICKNSWGKNDGYRGMRYMTKEQFLMSTMLVMIKE